MPLVNSTPLYITYKRPRTYNTQSSPNSIIFRLKLPSLTSSQQASLVTPFTAEEVLKVIHSLPANKSLSPDEFSNEYYNFF